MCVALWPVFDRSAVTGNRENLMEKASFRVRVDRGETRLFLVLRGKRKETVFFENIETTGRRNFLFLELLKG